MAKVKKLNKEIGNLENVIKKLSKEDLENVIILAEDQLKRKRLHKGNIKRMNELKGLIGDNRYFIFSEGDMIKLSDFNAFNIFRVNHISDDGIMNITRVFINKILSTGVTSAELSHYDLELTSIKTYDHIKNYWKSIDDDSIGDTFIELEKLFSQRDKYMKNMYNKVYRIGESILNNIK